MFNWLKKCKTECKKKKCSHEFHLLTIYEDDIDAGVGFDWQKLYIMYCPKCKGEITVLEHDYNKIIERQRVDKEYAERIKLQERDN